MCALSRVSAWLIHSLEVEVIVIAASRIEPCPTAWTLIGTSEILPNGHLNPARSTQHRRRIPIVMGPDFDCVMDQRIMAILAGIVCAATLHLDRDNVYGLVVVSAAGLGIQAYSVHVGTRCCHIYRVKPTVLRRCSGMQPPKPFRKAVFVPVRASALIRVRLIFCLFLP
jgi:hypothetical protein